MSQKENTTVSPDTSSCMKCPFYQREPEKYHKSCKDEIFADMDKLGFHIEASHTQNFRCYRCWQEMQSEDAFNEHIRKDPICTTQTRPADDRITRETLKSLKSVHFDEPPFVFARNNEQRWMVFYSILFPEDTEAPSPYIQN